MKRSLIIALTLFSFAGMAMANTFDDSRGAGQLSYTIFNLGPKTLTLTPYGPTPNPHASSYLVRNWGTQGGGELVGGTYKTNPASIFNYWPFDTPKNGNCDVGSNWPNQFDWVKNNYIFFALQADPIQYEVGYYECGKDPNTDPNDNPIKFYPNVTPTIDSGTGTNVCTKSETFTLKNVLNPVSRTGLTHRPAIADTYWLSDGSGVDGILFAGMASSTNMLIGGDPQSRVLDGQGKQRYPWCASRGRDATAYRNYAINPLAPTINKQTKKLDWDLVNNVWDDHASDLTDLYQMHPNTDIRLVSPMPVYDPENSLHHVYQNWGAGVVNADFAQNLNSPDDAEHGGVWFGAEVKNSKQSASLTLNNAMVPINLTYYSDPWSAIFDWAGDDFWTSSDSEYFNDVLVDYGALYTRNYGAHFTLAIGDPYLINSFSAKTLWYLATSTDFAFDNDGLDEAALTDLRNTLIASGSEKGLFPASSQGNAYLRWLLDAPKQALRAYNQTFTQAQLGSTVTIPAWKKDVFKAVKIGANLALSYATSSINVAWKAGGNAGVNFAVKVVDKNTRNHVINPFFNCISSECISTGATVPQSPTSQAVINDTYSGGGLLSSLLANVIVQAERNNQFSPNDPKLPIFSNYAINTDEGLCKPISTTNSMTDVAINGNFISADCYIDANGSGQVVNNNTTGGPTDYSNVLSAYPNSQDKTDTQVNLWSAILNNADITTIQDTTAPDRNGYMQLTDPRSAFTPPTQLVDLPTLRGETVDNPVVNMNVAFNQATGLLSVPSYTVLSGPDSTTQSPPPVAQPQLYLQVGKPPETGFGIDLDIDDDPDSVSFSSSSGFLTINSYKGTDNTMGGTWTSYQFDNGEQTIDLKQCEEDSEVILQLDFFVGTPDGSANGASASLYCIKNHNVGAEQAAPSSYSLLAVNVGDPNLDIMAPPDDYVSYDFYYGTLTVDGYSIGAGKSRFINGAQTIDLTQCAFNSAVTMTVVPEDDFGTKAYGFLNCQSPASLSYNSCTSDEWATGGVIVSITESPAADGTGAQFELACSCMPNYLGGASISSAHKLADDLPDDKNVAVGATSQGANFGGLGYTGDEADPGPGRKCE